VLVLVAVRSRRTALLTAVASAAVFLVLVWIRREHEIRMLAQAAADMLRKSARGSLVAGVLIGAVLLAIWPYRPDGVWTGLGGVILIGLSMAAGRLLRGRA